MTPVNEFNGKKVVVLGLARSGRAVALLLEQLGAQVTVNEGQALEDSPQAQELLAQGFRVVAGGHPVELLDEGFDLMVKNPGIPYSHPMVVKAKELGLPIWTEVEVAYRVYPHSMIGITGSNGKTTTTMMVAAILEAAERQPVLAGNIGFPASEVLPQVTADQQVVMELSSFQLMGVEAFHPHIAVINNILPSHLDYHESFAEYRDAKWAIQAQMTADDFLILNWNQALSQELAQETQAQVLAFSTQEKVNGAYLEDGYLVYQGERVMPAAQLGVPGEHNIENALAAILVVKQLGVDNEAIQRALAAFSGVKHRLQEVAEIEGVRFYNDSKSTNILATQKALSGFENSQVILIAGGLDRGNDLSELLPDIQGLKAMVILGEVAPRLAALAQEAGVASYPASEVAAATKQAFELAQKGDVVLFSPANASWDMYKNFEERGEVFLAAVKELEEA
ncbi:UDP-N-acetylmuramoyl-L-alanine--D-glutamate ligase [Streptococcus danieliae]|uniref:UDP-N-acetylmuramoylalanine--D-glutamate ligase n=1 Tax=Streptococcus danieliae TaxID=747656 RepID=A0A7Z0M5J7_9STRE|nr:UDP-N-acetylmuramoyl-L-alanine--D-glutamate ligase [Streptococcus danieliae]MBF0699085.1 UDP-N-acetylmuramoyl-L-alanine--D-glutamate ligase [Streptococcus danieliae]NYS96262.1 UDP-N-acetylmuramoyl-L-alanine--D-glutamate ligase [Streptococcus danieliae]